MSEVTAVYYAYDSRDTLLYVGISNSELQRLRQHQHQSNGDWADDFVTLRVARYATREEALQVEARDVRTLRPKWNIDGNPSAPPVLTSARRAAADARKRERVERIRRDAAQERALREAELETKRQKYELAEQARKKTVSLVKSPCLRALKSEWQYMHPDLSAEGHWEAFKHSLQRFEIPERIAIPLRHRFRWALRDHRPQKGENIMGWVNRSGFIRYLEIAHEQMNK